ncbi:hypothetical protein [Streptomyces sp. NPDC058280]|uniref:hypothetical protein n=1 Tax=Streptomyces sp. NPDC058280 TaxID=3346419 RepID=UPI0036E1E834
MDRTGPRIAALATATVLLLTLATGRATAVDKPTEPGELTLITTDAGKVLADKKGNPLYLRDADKRDVSDCAASCATSWPAAIGYPTKAQGVTGETSQTVLNAVNSDHPQVIYNAHPLYYYRNDRPNQPKGHRMPGFSLVAPDGTAMPDTGSTPTAASTKTAAPSPAKSAPASAKASAKATATATAKAPAQTADANKIPAPPAVATNSAAATAGTGAVSPSVGVLQITPSGAAKGGADHLTAADSSGPSVMAGLALTLGATAAAAVGTILVVRRHQRRATGGRH